MTRQSYVQDYVDGRRERKDVYACLNSTSTKMETCQNSNRISRTVLVDILTFLFQTEFATKLKKQKGYVEQGRILIQQKKQKLERLLRQVEAHISTLAEEESEKYIAYRAGNLPQEEYVRYRLWKDERLLELEKQKKQYNVEVKNLERKGETYLKAVRALISLKNQKEFTRELVEALIEKIYIYPGKRVEVVFTYDDIRMEGVE